MQRLNRTLGLLLLTTLMGCAKLEGVRADPGEMASPPSPDVKTGFSAMEHSELLPLLLPNGTQTKQIASYDTAGGDADGEWPSGWLRYIDQKGEYVIFDEVGPGCLYRQQINVFPNAWTDGYRIFSKFNESHIKYYFDNEETPRLDMPINELFGYQQKYTPPFTPPLVYYDNLHKASKNKANRFSDSFYPLPFAKRLKITIEPQSKVGCKWFQYTYLKYPPDTRVQTWAGTTVDSPIVRGQWDHLGVDPKDAAGNRQIVRDMQIPSGASVTALDLTGQGSIASLQFILNPYNPETLFKTNLTIYWDNQPTPAVDISLGRFFGAGGTGFPQTKNSWKKSFKSLFLGFDAKTQSMYCYWPMPYWSRARIELTNHGGTAITSLKMVAQYKLASALDYARGQAGYFHVKRTVDISPPNVPYSTAFADEGQGKVVGTFFDSDGYAMDGDEFDYFDDSMSPQIHGSGTEDDHNQGWGGDAYQKPLWGGMLNGFQAAYRYYMNESYIYNRNIRLTWEHSDAGGKRFGQKTDVVAFYYKAPEGFCNLKRTDELDIGNAAAEKAHDYSITGQTWTGHVACSYDVYEQDRKFNFAESDGRAFKGASEFTVRIDPQNQGVLLRRRCNRHMAQHQVAEVFVDGQKVSEFPWLVSELATPPETGWTDADYFIPAAMTAGREHITIKVQCLDSSNDQQGINEFHYWVYCYGQTRIEPAARP